MWEQSPDSEGKHPHVRGEDLFSPVTGDTGKETPPRAWGRQFAAKVEEEHGEKHPHVRGEDKGSCAQGCRCSETPPRAWGRLVESVEDALKIGNTPTCVGKTTKGARRKTPVRKHPHVRGEDQTTWSPGFVLVETPPRAWGRLEKDQGRKMMPRNTPTCVGKTCLSAIQGARCRKHPHVRGEDHRDSAGRGRGAETPPRAWGRQRRFPRCADPAGNTPTCVGKTRSSIS